MELESRNSKPGFERIAGTFWAVIEAIMTVAFTAMLIVMFIQVAARYVFGIGVPWTDETSRFLFLGEIFFGAAIAQRYGAQIRITVLLDVLPDRVRKWFDVVGDVLTAAIVTAVIVGCFQMMQRTGSVTAATLPISFANLYLMQAIGLFLLLLLILRDIVRLLQGRTRFEVAI